MPRKPLMTAKQCEMLLKLLQANPDFIIGSSSAPTTGVKSNKFWEDAAALLNNMEGCKKTCIQWRNVLAGPGQSQASIKPQNHTYIDLRADEVNIEEVVLMPEVSAEQKQLFMLEDSMDSMQKEKESVGSNPEEEDSVDSLHEDLVDPMHEGSVGSVHEESVNSTREKSVESMSKINGGHVREESLEPVPEKSAEAMREKSGLRWHKGTGPVRETSAGSTREKSAEPMQEKSTEPMREKSPPPIREKSRGPVRRKLVNSREDLYETDGYSRPRMTYKTLFNRRPANPFLSAIDFEERRLRVDAQMAKALNRIAGALERIVKDYSLNVQYSVRFNHAQLKADIPRRLIDKVLIANRGEIACRVIRTARKLGVRTVAVYSDADKHAMHVEMADEAYHIGPAPSTQSYLNAAKILEVAKRSNSKAIHPGYGFLSENVEFCEKCSNEGVIFIGPPTGAIRDMGIKSTSKAIMSNAGVPIVKGYHGDDQSIDRLRAEAQKIGFPLMIKAVRGGGGKGMRIAMTEDEFLTQLESAKRESLKSFGDESMLLEQYITDPRHVEVQVFADMHGNVVHLFERDCSVQRRHQKIIEEAPAPGISEETRRSLGEAAVRAAKAVGYVGAGTVEFILHRTTHEFHFMEMNTRLQVEHPITEMITGTDLVEWQLRVAAGEPLPLTQDEIIRRGHAVECRIYAEEPRAGFLPRAGTLHRLTQPTPEGNVRVETGVREGQEVSVHYDPMIAKLVVWGRDRTEALAKTRAKLSEYQVAGLETNVNFLLRLSGASAFVAGDVHTSFIPQHEAELFPQSDLELTEERAVQAALGYILSTQKDNVANDSWKGINVAPGAWRPNYQLRKTIPLKFHDKDVKVAIEYGSTANSYRVKVDNGPWRQVEATLEDSEKGLRLVALIDDKTSNVGVLRHDQQVHVYDENGQTVVELPRPKYQAASGLDEAASANSASSPTPGVLERILVNKGDKVVKGQPLFVVIAMKMEYVVRSPRDGVVAALADFKQGDAVGKGAQVVTLEGDS